MTKSTILHLGNTSIFVSSHIEMLEKHFNIEHHHFFLLNSPASKDVKIHQNIEFLSRRPFSFIAYCKLTLLALSSDKIIIHGMNDIVVIFILWLLPNLPKKTTWILWGSDLYEHQEKNKGIKLKIKEFFKRRVLRKIDCISTTIPEDFELAKKWYGVSATYIENIIYKSHIARVLNEQIREESETTRIQLGNSATKSNLHFDAIDTLSQTSANIKVYCPLSYGDEDYGRQVVEYGINKLGDRFVPMLDFMDFEKYNRYMAGIDISIFNHSRQQAMGNIIGMLSLGKKVYLNNNATPYTYFKRKGFHVYSLKDGIDYTPLTKAESTHNIDLASRVFSEKNMIESWRQVFER